MKRIISIFLFSFCLLTYSQIAPPKELVLDNPNELNLGINFNTHASLIGGITLKYYKQYSLTKGNSFMVEFVNIKHPKEIRVTNTASRNNSSYIYGKYNSLLAIRTLYGKQFLIFNKTKDEGVEFSLNTSGGIIWGIEKPYYVLINSNNSPDSSGYYPYKDVKNPDSQVVGQGNLFMGFNESKIVPGASLRLSGIIEFGITKDNTIGIELGTQVDAFSRKIQILPYVGDKNLFISAFFVGYMGIRW